MLRVLCSLHTQQQFSGMLSALGRLTLCCVPSYLFSITPHLPISAHIWATFPSHSTLSTYALDPQWLKGFPLPVIPSKSYIIDFYSILNHFHQLGYLPCKEKWSLECISRYHPSSLCQPPPGRCLFLLFFLNSLNPLWSDCPHSFSENFVNNFHFANSKLNFCLASYLTSQYHFTGALPHLLDTIYLTSVSFSFSPQKMKMIFKHNVAQMKPFLFSSFMHSKTRKSS